MKKEPTSKLNEYFHNKAADAIPEVSRQLLSESPDKSGEYELELLWDKGENAVIDEKELEEAFEKVNSRIGPSSRKRAKHRILCFLRNTAAILFIPLLILSICLVKEFRMSGGGETSVVWHDLYAAYGEHIEMFLPDSSKVTLNSGSHLIYPERFGDVRQVFASGEIFFDVLKDSKKPFVVETSDMTVNVHGTTFNIRSYPEEQNSEATLLYGAISLKPKSRSFGEVISMKPGQKVTVGKKEIVVSEFRLSDYKNWTNPEMIFNNETMGNIVKELERIYNVEISIRERSLSERRLFVAYAPGMCLDDMLRALDIDNNFEFKREMNRVEIKKRYK